MRFCVLGPLEAYADERSVAVGGGRQRALLALLLVHAGEVVSRDRLIEELWTGEPPPSGPKSLDVYLSRLRRAFREVGAGDVLITRAPGYLLHVEETDARRFEALAAEGRKALAAGEAEWAARVLAEALALWRGAAYAEVADEPWARAEAGRLAELRLSATEDRIEAELTLGRHTALVPELELLVTREPARERLVGQLMLALYRSGRQADALAAYRAARCSLVEELGLEPGPELRRLEAAVLAQDPALELPAKPAAPSLSPAATPPGRRTAQTLAGAGRCHAACSGVGGRRSRAHQRRSQHAPRDHGGRCRGCRSGHRPRGGQRARRFRAGRHHHRRGQHLGDQRRRWHGHQD